MGEYITEELYSQIAEIAAKEAVKAFRDAQIDYEKKIAKENDKVKKTKKLLSSYRRMKRQLSEEKEFTPEEKIELRWKFIEDLMGNANAIISKSDCKVIDTEKKRREDMYYIYCIENAIRMYQEECELSNNETAQRRFRELYAMYIAEEETPIVKIAEKENVSEKTVWKDLGISCGIVAVYLLGI